MLGGVASSVEDKFRIWNDLDKLEKWPEINKMKLNKDKYKVLHLERKKKNQMQKYKIGDIEKGNWSAEIWDLRLQQTTTMG